MKLLSRVRLFATPWTIAYQAPLSMGFSRPEYWSGVPLPSLQILNAGEGVEKQEPSHTVGENVNWCSHCGELHRVSLKNSELPYDPTIQLLGMYVENTHTHKHTQTPLI